MAKHPAQTVSTPEKTTFTIEAYIAGEPREKLEWMQKFFSFFHPTLQAKVMYNGEPVLNSKPKEPERSLTEPVFLVEGDVQGNQEKLLVKSTGELYPQPDPLSLV